MSEDAKVDTSSHRRVVKNPLLSASVTGLTIDDFPNKPLLLPPAALPVPAPVVTPAAQLSSREAKTLVTVGKSTDIDTESLDEINLNAPTDDSQPAFIDVNANAQTQSNHTLSAEYDAAVNSESILSQAASSFSALPSVASNVFSTFSKRIYNTSNGSSREVTPSCATPVLDISGTEFVNNNNSNIAPTPFDIHASVESTIESIPPPIEPPKFYTPTEIPTLPSAVAAPPSAGTAANTYRLSAKKKLYAPIPDFAATTAHYTQQQQHQQPLQQPTVNVSALSTTYTDVYHQQDPYQQDASSAHKQTERKSGGLFSLTNLVPTGVLQNLTGLVQTAADTITGAQNTKAELADSNSSTNVNFFAASATAIGQPLNYIAAAAPAAELAAPPTAGFVANSLKSNIVAPPAAHNFFQPTSIEQSTPANYFAPTAAFLPTSTAALDNDTIRQTDATSTAFPNYFNQPANAAVETASSIAVNSPSPSAADSTLLATQAAVAQNSNSAAASESASFINTTGTAADAVHPSHSEPSIATTSPINFFAAAPLPFALGVVPQLQQIHHIDAQALPAGLNSSSNSAPTAAQLEIVPPPTTGFGLTQAPPLTATASSFRLQKGTRHYKSALNSTPISTPLQSSYATPLVQQLPVSFFNPLTESAIPTQQQQQQNQLLVPTAAAAPINENITSLQPFDVAQTADNIVPLQPPRPAEQYPTLPLHSQQQHCEPTAATTVLNDNTAPSQQQLPLAATQPVKAITEAVASSQQLFAATPTVVALVESSTNVGHSAVAAVAPVAAITSTTTPSNFFETHTIEAVTESEENFEETKILPPPLPIAVPPKSIGSVADAGSNPFRRGSRTNSISAAVPVLASFFTPATPTGTSSESGAGGDFNFFAVQPAETTEQAEQISNTLPTAPFETVSFPALPLAQLDTAAVTTATTTDYSIEAAAAVEAGIPPPIGFDLICRETENNSVTATAQQAAHSVSNFFTDNSQQTSISALTFAVADQPDVEELQQQPTAPIYIDNDTNETVELAPINSNSNEEQLLQQFFNNPPPAQADSAVAGYLNFGSGLSLQQQHQLGAVTPASNIAEPPTSSACSEYSELSNRPSLTDDYLSHIVKPQPILATAKQESQSWTYSTEADKNHIQELPAEILQELKMANLLNDKNAPAQTGAIRYTPAVKHWFYKRLVGNKPVWLPFSHYDSALLETSLPMTTTAPNIVAVEGGRYDVNIAERTKSPVYWEAAPSEVRRCSWFYKGVDSKYVPYEEGTADLLEAEYKQAAESGEWHKKIIISMGEQVVFHGPTVIVHFQQQQTVDAWGGSSQTATRPRVVKRDLDDFTIEEGESQHVDHLLFMVHGIGSACDLKMRTVEEVVDDFRTIAQQLVRSHYKNSTEFGIVGRVEVLPVSWHGHLHSEEMDEKLKSITLESIPKLRNFTNDTLLDVLFYTSPTYCQKIMNIVVTSMNELYVKYRERHPDFNGGVSLAGHSLGSLIVFDLLCHQNPIKECEEENLENPNQPFTPQNLDSNLLLCGSSNDIASKQISYTVGPAGTGQPFIHYTQLIFQPKKFFALGSPIGMFVTIRGIDKLGLDFRLPTCAGFYNIFHPFDPVAYRIEALINPDMSGIRPVLIPHHKGRKRMHLELKETMTRVGADLKQRFFDTFKSTLDSVNFLGAAASSSRKKETLDTMEKEVDKVLEMQMQSEYHQQQQQEQQELQEQEQQQQLREQLIQSAQSRQSRSRANSSSTTHSETEMVEVDFPLGKLNDSKRVDYVLQEAPLEFFNEYIFALSSHVCYWESEDTILFVMKEIYAGLGISPDSQVPQQSMSIERPSSRNSSIGVLPSTLNKH